MGLGCKVSICIPAEERNFCLDEIDGTGGVTKEKVPKGLRRRNNNKNEQTYIVNVPHALLGIDVRLENADDLLLARGLHDDGAAVELPGGRVVGLGDFLESGACVRVRGGEGSISQLTSQGRVASFP